MIVDRFSTRSGVPGRGRAGAFAIAILAAGWLSLFPGRHVDAGELASADSAWTAGDHAVAVGAYFRELERDPTSVRANYRVALWLSWRNQLDSALVMIRRARAMDATDGDLAMAQARFLAWDGRYDESVTLYDSVLARGPERAEAHVGRAQALGWAGRYDAADSSYLEALHVSPTDPGALDGRAQLMEWKGDTRRAESLYAYAAEQNAGDANALVGLARLRMRQGRVRLAQSDLHRALALDPRHAGARRLELDLRAAARPQLALGFTTSQDSDRNLVWDRTFSVTTALGDGLRGFVGGGSTQASDPARDATRTSGEIGGSYASGAFQAGGAVGARRLDSNAAADRSTNLYRGTVSARRGAVGVGIGASRHSFDESALLIGSGLDVREIEGNVEARRRSLTVSGNLGLARLSDGNARRWGVLSAMESWGHGWSAGMLLRLSRHDMRGVGYFSPDRFVVAEARGGFSWQRRKWESTTRGGVGLQQVGSQSLGQFQGHFEQSIAYSWAAISRVELSLGASNSASSSTTGAYGSFTSALAARFGF
jgi:tetratricopeptide (TPR) repeat protein